MDKDDAINYVFKDLDPRGVCECGYTLGDHKKRNNETWCPHSPGRFRYSIGLNEKARRGAWQSERLID